jgi:3-isopropylmalate/(R)-2-methylmalate dehydratase small subunit
VSFGRIFYRNSLNFGMPALFFPAAAEIRAGDEVEVDVVAGRIRDLTTGGEWTVNGLPPHLMAMVGAGGLMPWLKARLAPDRAGVAP